MTRNERRRVICRRYLLLVLLTVLAGCATGPADRPTPPPGQRSPTDPLVAEWRREAERELQRGNWYGALDVAEQGLRFNRRDPLWYLVMAEGYLGLQQWQQAETFALQGQRFAAQEPDLRPRLDAVLQAARARLSR